MGHRPSQVHACGRPDGDARRRVQKTIVALAEAIPDLIGGSGDLDPSTRTALKGKGDFKSPEFTRTCRRCAAYPGNGGRSVRVRRAEYPFRHSRARHGRYRHRYGPAWRHPAIRRDLFTFSDYMRPSIRLAALSKAHVIYVWTHDSIGLGEDGPTHQPIEQLASLRAMPDLMLLRPADANETVEAWKLAVAHTEGPWGWCLRARSCPFWTAVRWPPLRERQKELMSWPTAPQVCQILIATGSEVSIALEAHNQLTREGVASRLVSMPCWDLFQAQPQSYKDALLPPGQSASQCRGRLPARMERHVGLDGAISG